MYFNVWINSNVKLSLYSWVLVSNSLLTLIKPFNLSTLLVSIFLKIMHLCKTGNMFISKATRKKKCKCTDPYSSLFNLTLPAPIFTPVLHLTCISQGSPLRPVSENRHLTLCFGPWITGDQSEDGRRLQQKLHKFLYYHLLNNIRECKNKWLSCMNVNL